MDASAIPEYLETFPEPVLAVSAAGTVLAANVSAVNLLGLTGHDRPEVTLRELTATSAGELDCVLSSCLATTSPVPMRLTFFPAAQPAVVLGCEGWRCALDDEEAVLLRLHEEVDKVSRFSELSRLVDELNSECMARRDSELRLRTALDQLHDINNIRDHMLSQVSHDLRTPLNAVLGMSEFMLTEPFGTLDEKYAEYVRDIHQSGEALLEMVDQVLHLTSDDMEHHGRTTEALVDLSECLDNCRKIVEPLARMRGLEVLIPDDMTLPKLKADQMLVKQILMNLLGNATKFTERGGRVEVFVEWQEGGALAIRVKDSGPGISDSRMAAIKLGRYRDSAYVTDAGTSGFGLALSRRSARAIGADIDVQTTLGKGTVASLLLPMSLVAPGPAGS